MKPSLLSTAVAAASLSLISSVAWAGGLDRSGQDTSIITDDGNVVEFANVSVAPSVTGTYTAGGVGATGDVTPDYSMTMIGLKMDVSDTISVALIRDNPYGADVSWEASALNGTKGSFSSTATTLIGSYGLDDGISVYAGVKDQSLQMSSANNLLAYTITGAKSSATGFLAGVAFEKPEIAMKVALTYHAKVKHSMNVVEDSAHPTLGGLVNNASSTMDFYTPSAINLDFQTGIAEDTLLFGSIRKANWTETDVHPDGYHALTYAASGNTAAKSLLNYNNDSTAYNIGLGRRFSEAWSGAVTYGYEASNSGTGGPFSPTNGSNKYGVGVTYSVDNISATLAVQHVEMGDQIVSVQSGAITADMASNSTLVTALKVSAKF